MSFKGLCGEVVKLLAPVVCTLGSAVVARVCTGFVARVTKCVGATVVETVPVTRVCLGAAVVKIIQVCTGLVTTIGRVFGTGVVTPVTSSVARVTKFVGATVVETALVTRICLDVAVVKTFLVTRVAKRFGADVVERVVCTGLVTSFGTDLVTGV